MDLDDHPLLARSEVGVFVLTQVLPREHVDVLERALVDDLRRAADHHVAGLLVLGGQDGYGRAWIALDVGDLGPASGAVDEDVLAVVVDPDRGRLRRSVLADGRDHAPVAVGEELRLLLAQRGHRFGLLVSGRGSTELRKQVASRTGRSKTQTKIARTSIPPGRGSDQTGG